MRPEVELEAELLEIETDGARWPVVHSTLMPADLISRIPGFERFIGLPRGVGYWRQGSGRLVALRHFAPAPLPRHFGRVSFEIHFHPEEEGP